MKAFSFAVVTVLFSLSAHSNANIKFSFQGEELNKVIDIYSKASGQKFVLDPSVRGKVWINGADNVSNEEAFNLLSSALATNNYAVSKQGDVMVVLPARIVARDLSETTTTLPSLKPQRLATYMIQLKYISAEEINKNLRFLPSKDGEMNAFSKTNTLVITDWTSNIQRIDQVLRELDKPVDPRVAKLVLDTQTERDKRRSKEPTLATGAAVPAPQAPQTKQ